jgi:hypothetical protein
MLTPERYRKFPQERESDNPEAARAIALVLSRQGVR